MVLIVNLAAAYFLYMRDPMSSQDCGGFSWKLMAKIVFRVWYNLLTATLDCEFFTVVRTDMILFLKSICKKSGPKNSLPLSCIHLLGVGYWLMQLVSSKVFATFLKFFIVYWNHFGQTNECIKTSDCSELVLKVINDNFPWSYHVYINFIPKIVILDIL